MTSSTAPLSTDLNLDTAEVPRTTFDDIVINVNDTDNLRINSFDLAGLDGYSVTSFGNGLYNTTFGTYRTINGRDFRLSPNGDINTRSSEAILKGGDTTETVAVTAVDADGNEITGNIIFNQFNTSPDPAEFVIEKEGDGFIQYTNGDLRVTAIEAYKRDEDGKVSTVLAVSNISGRTLTGEETAFLDPLGEGFIYPIGSNASMAVIDNVGNVVDTDASFRGFGFSDDTLRGSFGANGESKIWITPEERFSGTRGINYDSQFFDYEENVIQPGDGYAIVFTGDLNTNQSGLDFYAPDIDFDALSNQPLDAIYFQADGVPLVGEDGYIAQLLSENSTGADITLLSEAVASLTLDDTTDGFQYSFVSAVDVEVDNPDNGLDVEAVELSDGRKLYTISSTEGATEVPTEITLESPQRLSEDNVEAFIQDTVEEAVENVVEFVEATRSLTDWTYRTTEGTSLRENLFGEETDLTLTSVNGQSITQNRTITSVDGVKYQFYQDGRIVSYAKVIKGEDINSQFEYTATDADGNELSGTVDYTYENSGDPPLFTLEEDGEGFQQYTNGDLRITTIAPYRLDEEGRAVAVVAVSNISGRTLTGEELTTTQKFGGSSFFYGSGIKNYMVNSSGEVVGTDNFFVNSTNDELRGSWEGGNQIRITPFITNEGFQLDFKRNESIPQSSLSVGESFAVVFTYDNDIRAEQYGLTPIEDLSNEPLDAIYFQANGVPLVGEDGYIAQLLSENSTGADITLLSEVEASLELENTEGGFQYSFVSAVGVEVDDADPSIEVETVELSDGRKLYTISSAEDATEVPTEITLESSQRLSEENIDAFVQDTVEEAVENVVDFVEAAPTVSVDAGVEGVDYFTQAATVPTNTSLKDSFKTLGVDADDNYWVSATNGESGSIETGKEYAFIAVRNDELNGDKTPVEGRFITSKSFTADPNQNIYANFSDEDVSSLFSIDNAKAGADVWLWDVEAGQKVGGKKWASTMNKEWQVTEEQSAATGLPEYVDPTTIEEPAQSPTLIDIDLLTGMGMEADTGYFQREYFRADTNGDKFGYKGISDSGDQLFVIKDSFDNNSEDLLTGTNYGIMLTEKGASVEDAFASDDFIMSDRFSVTEGQRTFVAMDGDDVSAFMGSTDMEKYAAHLINLDTLKADMSRGVGGLTKDTNANFDGRLDQWGVNNPLLATATDVF